MNDAIQVVQIEKTNKTLWDEFVHSATEGNIFQTFEWAEAMKKAAYGQTNCLAMKKNDEIIAGILLMTTTFNGKIILCISSFMSQEGPIIKDKKVSINPVVSARAR